MLLEHHGFSAGHHLSVSGKTYVIKPYKCTRPIIQNSTLITWQYASGKGSQAFEHKTYMELIKKAFVKTTEIIHTNTSSWSPTECFIRRCIHARIHISATFTIFIDFFTKKWNENYVRENLFSTYFSPEFNCFVIKICTNNLIFVELVYTLCYM